MKHSRMFRIICGMALCLLIIAVSRAVPVQATVRDLSEVCQIFETAIQEGEMQITFQAPAGYTLEQLLKQLSKAAKKQDMLFTGEYTYQKQEADEFVTYTFVLTSDSLLKVQRLKNRKDACKAALKALKNCDYATKFYSSTSYYSDFMLMLRQHPEYNYNTLAWKNSNGTYGYRRSRELTKADQKKRMNAADRQARAFVKKYLNDDMDAVQKLRVIHDYLIGRCAYDYSLEKVTGYEDALTAYGALVKRRAVCQGYTAAFNLLARTAGFDSIAVCGAVSTGDHAWNYVRVGDKYRYMDCTWDKTLQTGADIRYDYFLIEKRLISQNHTWNKKQYHSKYVEYCRYVR